jgi:hypothetical protein
LWLTEKSAKLKEMTYTTPVLAKVEMAGIEFWQHDAEYNVLDENPAIFGDRQTDYSSHRNWTQQETTLQTKIK